MLNPDLARRVNVATARRGAVRKYAALGVFSLGLGISLPAVAYWCFAGGLYSGSENTGRAIAVERRTVFDNGCVSVSQITVYSCVGVLVSSSPNTSTSYVMYRSPECAVA